MKKDLKEAILGIEVTQFDGQKADLEELVNPKQLEKIISDWMPEVLSKEWISENVEYAYFDMLDGSGRLSSATAIIKPEKLKNLLAPKQEEVDRAYKDGYEKGKQHTFYKGYLEGLAEGERKTNEYFESITEEPSYDQVQKYLSEHGFEVVEKEPERVADVVTTFWKSYERLKEVMSMEVKELEE